MDDRTGVPVLPGGEIPWTHYMRDASDTSSVDELLEALNEVLG